MNTLQVKLSLKPLYFQVVLETHEMNLRYRTLTQIRKYNIGLDPISARDSTNPSF